MRSLHFLVNPTSGGRRGRQLATQLRGLVPAGDVFMLGECDPIEVAKRAIAGGEAALIACGGDGTAAAALEASWQIAGERSLALPVGIIPLGTGNDLARCLGWDAGGSAAGLEGMVARLRQADTCRIDRWMVHGPGGARAWYNYWSLGIDARIAVQFHRLRHRHPAWFRAPWPNRLLYAGLGVRERGNPLSLVVRGAVRAGMSLPAWASALVLANIPSYAGGVRLGAGIRADDGRLDAFALGHGLALGMATSGLRRPCFLGTRSELELRLVRAMAMQIDGEPLIAPPGLYRIARAGTVIALRSSEGQENG